MQQLGKAFTQCEKDAENMLFWIQPTNKIHTHYTSSHDDPIVWWNDHYLPLYGLEERTLKTHIYYKNAQTDKNWMSGITIDSDMFIRVDELDFVIRSQRCKEHIKDQNDDCDKCIAIQNKFKNNVDKSKVQKLFEQCIQTYNYYPYSDEIKCVQMMVEDLILFIKKHFDIKYDDIFTEEQAFKYTILCRDNINLSKARVVDGVYYYRYGFHTYLFEIKLDQVGKDYIKRNFHISERTKIQLEEQCEQTKLSEFLDVAPLVGTTALPLSATGDKIYNKYYNTESQLIQFVDDSDEVLSGLNPFGGQLIQLKSEFIPIQQGSMDLLTQCRLYKSYEESIFVIRNQLKQFKEDFQFKILLDQYRHPDYSYRMRIVASLYGYIMDEKRVNQSLLTIQQCFYLIMCENIEDIIHIERFTNTPKWLDDKKAQESNRYPKKIVEFVMAYHQLQKKHNKSKSYKFLFDTYNQYKIDQDLEYECIKFDPLMQISYKNFTNFIQLYENGVNSEMFFSVLRNQKHWHIVQDVFFQYIFSQVEQNMIISNSQFFYFQEEEGSECVYDNNKFHLIQNGQVEGIVVNIMNKLKNGLSEQMGAMKNGKDGYEMYKLYKEYYNLDRKKRQDFMDDLEDDQKAFVCQYDNYLELQSAVNRYTSTSKTKSTVQELIVEKLSKQLVLQQIDTQQNCFGCYNGIIEYDKLNHKFLFHTGIYAKQFCISKSMMFKVQPEFIDANSQFVTPDKLPLKYKIIYDDLINIYDKIYNNGKDIEVFHWIVFQIIDRILDKNKPGEKLLLDYGTGSDAKTTGIQSLCNTLGQGQQMMSFGNQHRKIISSGYTSQGKSTMLQTKPVKSSGHDQGGFAELPGCYLCLMTELASSDPLVSSAIKNLLCGTQIAARACYGTTMMTFFNTCFLILQTNYYPTFDQTLDDGLIRRICFYQHCVKFVSKAYYDTLSDQQKEHHAIADEKVRQNLTSNPDYIDTLGYLAMQIYLNYEHESDYEPQIIKEQTARFFASSLIYMQQCMSHIQRDEDSTILFSFFENKMRDFMNNQQQKISKKKQQDSEQLIDNHITQLKQTLIQDIYAKHIETQNEQCISMNEFQQFQDDDNYVIIIKCFKFKDILLQQQNDDLLQDQLESM